jgi:hypothetical protein
MSFVECYLPYFSGQWLITRPLLALLTFQSLFTESSHGDQLLAPPPFSGALRAPHPPSAVCSFSGLCLLFSLFVCLFVLQGGGQSVQEAMLVYPKGSCRNTAYCLFAHLLVCISQAGLELASGAAGVLLFSQCNMA